MPMDRATLDARVQRIQNIFGSLTDTDPHFNALTPLERSQLITGINKAYGQALAFLHERKTYRAAVAKGRTVTTQTHGDGTIGAKNYVYAKTIECKSNTGESSSGVTQQIRQALKQIAGDTGHSPRKGDARVIDVLISEPSNRWPYNGGTYGTPRPAVAVDALWQAAKDVIRDEVGNSDWNTVLKRQKYHGQNPTVRRLSDWTNPAYPAETFPSSTKLWWENDDDDRGYVSSVTFKIRYDPEYPLISAIANETHALEYMVLQAFRKPGQNHVSVQRAKTIIAVTYTATGTVVRRELMR